MADDFLEQALSDTPIQEEPEVATPEPETAVEPTPETVEEPAPQPEQRGPGYVPLDAMLSEREKRQTAERERDELRRAQQQPANIPDPFDDPDGYRAHLGQELQSALQAQKVDMSWAFAVQQHGEDTVKAAKDWALEKAQKDPGFRSMLDTEFSSQAMPIDWIVQQHKRDALLSDIGDPSKLDDWFAREAAKRGYVTQSAPVAVAPPVVATTPAPKQAMPPRSIAADASPTTSPAPASPMAELDAIFERR